MELNYFSLGPQTDLDAVNGNLERDFPLLQAFGFVIVLLFL